MNRLEMAKNVAELVPKLAQRDKEVWENAEILRRKFVSDYPPRRIPHLKLDQFVIGKGAENLSFCYRLEREMDVLGRILGATASKFGVYYGRIKSDATRRYRFAKHWGSTYQKAFPAVKQAIVDLLVAADKKDFVTIAQNKLSPMFKGKILFLYHPDQYAPIYAWPYLDHFVKALDLDGDFVREADMQRALMRYRAKWPKLREQHPSLFQRFLYQVFGNPKDTSSSWASTTTTPFLKTAVAGAQFITKLPTTPSRPPVKSYGYGKTDHSARQKRTQRIGDRGELVVLALEKKRLILAGKKKLAGKIDHVAQKYDGLGYDILSFEENGEKRPIEVKATTAPDLQNGFYITANELEKSGQLPNYYLYLVFSAMSKKPRVFPMKQPNLKGSGFELHPQNYLVTTNL